MIAEGGLPAVRSRHGPIERLGGRTRIVIALSIIVFVTVAHRPLVLGTALAGVLLLVLAARLRWTDLRGRLLHVEGFLLVLVLLLPFSVPGQPLVAFGPFIATKEGALRALTLLVKVNICMLTVVAMLGSMDPVRFAAAAVSLGLPPKFARLVQFTIRYVSVFGAESARLMESMRARGFRPRSNLHTWRTFGTLAGMLLVRSLERARSVEEAMRCRGFTGHMPASLAPTAGGFDLVFGSAFACVMLALLVIEFAT